MEAIDLNELPAFPKVRTVCSACDGKGEWTIPPIGPTKICRRCAGQGVLCHPMTDHEKLQYILWKIEERTRL